jgi:hypothetical protein
MVFSTAMNEKFHFLNLSDYRVDGSLFRVCGMDLPWFAVGRLHVIEKRRRAFAPSIIKDVKTKIG